MKGETKIGTMVEWPAEERAAKEKEWRQALFNLRLQKATGQLENPMRIRSLRRDIARLKTLASQSVEAKGAKGAKEAKEAKVAKTAKAASAAAKAAAVKPKAETEKTIKKAAKTSAPTKSAPKKADKKSAGAKARA